MFNDQREEVRNLLTDNQTKVKYGFKRGCNKVVKLFTVCMQ